MSLVTEGKVTRRAGPVTPADLPPGLLHVVVFGPGHGEAVLIRTPDGRVGVVDGCGEPPAASDRGGPLFSLIEDLGEKRLLFACVTHPHQDHFGGFARLIQKHPPEHLWWSGSQERKFFQHYRAWLKKRGRDLPVGDEEPPGIGLERLVRAINAAAEAESPSRRSWVKHLEDHKHLLSHPAPPGTVEIEGILPSSTGVRAAARDAYQVLEEGKLDDAKRVFDPNRISGALLVTWGETRVLLGGDALVESDPHAGWEGLSRGLGKVHVVKVPHHASEGAHSASLWAKMAPELALVTCVQYARNKQPPRPDMLQKLLGTGAEVVLTSPPTWWAEEPHALAVDPPAVTPKPATDPGNPALPAKSWLRSAANKHENAVVVSLDATGSIVGVQLHGDACQLHLAAPPAAGTLTPAAARPPPEPPPAADLLRGDSRMGASGTGSAEPRKNSATHLVPRRLLSPKPGAG